MPIKYVVTFRLKSSFSIWADVYQKKKKIIKIELGFWWTFNETVRTSTNSKSQFDKMPNMSCIWIKKKNLTQESVRLPTGLLQNQTVCLTQILNQC